MGKNILEYLTNLWYSIIKIRDSKVKVMGKYNALDIATWFIYKTNAEKKENQAVNDDYEVYEGLTHLKLQKLLYFAQGISLATNGRVMFTNKIEAWEHGPVVKDVFNFFSSKGRNEITLDDAPSDISIIRKIEADTATRNILNVTYDSFAIYTAWQLRNMTHIKNGPWDKVYELGKNRVIPVNLIQEYFDKEIME